MCVCVCVCVWPGYRRGVCVCVCLCVCVAQATSRGTHGSLPLLVLLPSISLPPCSPISSPNQ